MRIFVGYGYNSRDAWIEQDVFPILQSLNLEISHGKDMYGEVLQDAVKYRIEQASALIGFCTLRQGQGGAAFNSHIWVRDELQHAMTLNKPIVEVREKGVRNPPGLIGDRQRIDLDPDNRLKCIGELIKVVSAWRMRRLLLVPTDQRQSRRIHQAVATDQLLVRYRTRVGAIDSRHRDGKVEKLDQGLYLDAIGLPELSLVEIEGRTKTDGIIFKTGWTSADLIRIIF
jgi:hypothetical protein